MTTLHDLLPRPRGPLSREVLRVVRGSGSVGGTGDGTLPPGSPHDEDFQLALWMLNVVQVGSFLDVDDHAVSSLRLNNLRWYLNRTFEDRMRSLVPQPSTAHLVEFIDHLCSGAPTADRGSADLVADRFVSKAPYLAWEADPHTLMLARAEPPIAQVVAEIQAGEYGVGHGDTHATVFRRCLEAMDTSLIEVLDEAPAESYAFANLAWLFGAERRLRGASLGQLCYLELDSVEPYRRAIEAWDRTGLPDGGRRWYDIHVLADEEHARIVRDRLVPAIETHTPHLMADAVWGAAVTHELLALVDRAVRRRHIDLTSAPEIVAQSPVAAPAGR